MGLSQQQYAEYRTWSLPYVTDTLISIFFFLLPVFLSVYELSGAFIIVLSALLRLKRTDPKPIALVLSLLKMQLDFMIYPPPNSTGVFFIGVYRCTTGGGVRGVYQYRFAGWFGYRFIANRIPFHRKSDTVSSQKGVVRIPFHRKSDTVSSQKRELLHDRWLPNQTFFLIYSFIHKISDFVLPSQTGGEKWTIRMT
jgi:hypothetical protein